MNQNPFGGQDPFDFLRRQMEEQLKQKQQSQRQKTNKTSWQNQGEAGGKSRNRSALIPMAIR